MPNTSSFAERRITDQKLKGDTMIQKLILSLVVLALTSESQAQITACWTSCVSGVGGVDTYFPLLTTCDGGQPLPDGTLIKIYWDANGNGPDAIDEQPEIGEGYAQFNFNTFTINGEAMLGIPGTFINEAACFHSPYYFPVPPRYYLVVETPEIRWVSAVVELPDEYYEPTLETPEEWSCESRVPCGDEQTVWLDWYTNGPGYSECIDLYHEFDGVRTICLGPFPMWCSELTDPQGFYGPIYVGYECCSNPLPTDSFEWDPVGSYWQEENGQWWVCTDIHLLPSSPEGSVCVNIDICLSCGQPDCWLPVELSSFDAMSTADGIMISIQSASEMNLSHYEIMRSMVDSEFEQIASLPAENSASGATYAFLDDNVVVGQTYRYLLRSVDLDGSVTEFRANVATEMWSPDAALPTELALNAYPNPFNPVSRLAYSVPQAGLAQLKVFDPTGRIVATLVDGFVEAGEHAVDFNGRSLASGVYFAQLQSAGVTRMTRLVLLK